MRFKKIYIEITNKCNKNCFFCSKDNLPKREMTLKEFETVINKIKPYTKYIYLHVKGEPLLHSKFPKIINLCEKNNMNVNITTNGTFLPKYKKVLRNKIIRQINISFQSFKDGNIEDTIEAVNYILKNKSVNIVYRFWALTEGKLSKENFDIINKIIFAYNLNCDFIEKIDRNKNVEIKERLYINKASLFIWPNENKDKLEESFCNGLKTHIGILSNGTVVPCCLDSSANVKLGNIYDESLEAILLKEKTQNIINFFKQNRCYEEFCKKCSYRLNHKKML